MLNWNFYPLSLNNIKQFFNTLDFVILFNPSLNKLKKKFF